MKVKVDKDICIGCGLCVSLAGAVFRLDDSGKSEVIDEHGADDATIRLAAESCPVHAIFLNDEKTNEQLFPPMEAKK